MPAGACGSGRSFYSIALVRRACWPRTALFFWQRAIQANRLANSRELAGAAVNNLQVDPERSVLLALQALEEADTLEARNALHQAVPELHLLYSVAGGEPGGLPDVAYSPDGATLGHHGGLWPGQTIGMPHTGDVGPGPWKGNRMSLGGVWLSARMGASWQRLGPPRWSLWDLRSGEISHPVLRTVCWDNDWLQPGGGADQLQPGSGAAWQWQIWTAFPRYGTSLRKPRC